MVNVKVIHQKQGEFKPSDMLTIQLPEFSRFECCKKFVTLVNWDLIIDTSSVIIFENEVDNMLFVLCEELVGIRPTHNMEFNKKPYWAKYKAVNSDGTAYWYENKPFNLGANWYVEDGRYAPVSFNKWCYSLTDLD